MMIEMYGCLSPAIQPTLLRRQLMHLKRLSSNQTP